MTERRVAAGIYRTPSGWRFYVRVAGQLYARRLPATTPLQEVKDARAALRLELRGTPAARGSLAADVAKYLTIVAAMPTWRERRRHLEWWVRWLGPQRRRATITPGEIQAGLGALVVDGYAPQTVAHFRTALRHLWHVLDGRHATNPVRATVAPRPPAPGDRALTPAIVTAILGEFRRTSKTYARLAVMATTGLPQKQLMALTPTHVDLAARRLRRPGRAKGRGTPDDVVPLSSAAVRALAQFAAVDAWGPFSTSAMHARWQDACVRARAKGVPVPPCRPYDLRHSWGTMIYRLTHDLATTRRLLGHASLSTTQRYALGAAAAVDAAAVAKASRQSYHVSSRRAAKSLRARSSDG